MADKKFIPYVPAETSMPELTFKALFLGVVMAVVLGAANAHDQGRVAEIELVPRPADDKGRNREDCARHQRFTHRGRGAG